MIFTHSNGSFTWATEMSEKNCKRSEKTIHWKNKSIKEWKQDELRSYVLLFILSLKFFAIKRLFTCARCFPYKVPREIFYSIFDYYSWWSEFSPFLRINLRKSKNFFFVGIIESTFLFSTFLFESPETHWSLENVHITAWISLWER